MQNPPGLMEGVGPGHVGGPSLALPPAATAAVAPSGLGPLVRLIAFNANDPGQSSQLITKDPQVITASIRVLAPFAPGPGSLVPGPFEALLEWGSGNGPASSARVDIPLGPIDQNSQGAIHVTVLGTYVNVSARNNSNLLVRAGDSPLGNPGVDPIPAAGVSLAIGNRPGGPAPVTLTQFAAFNPAGGLAAAGTAGVVVPSMARAFTIFRTPATVPISFTVGNVGALLDGPYTVAAGVPAPRVVLPANAGGINITNTGVAALTAVGVIFEIEL